MEDVKIYRDAFGIDVETSGGFARIQRARFEDVWIIGSEALEEVWGVAHSEQEAIEKAIEFLRILQKE